MIIHCQYRARFLGIDKCTYVAIYRYICVHMKQMNPTGHLRVAPNLCFKARLGKKALIGSDGFWNSEVA